MQTLQKVSLRRRVQNSLEPSSPVARTLLKNEQELANNLLVEWRVRTIWQNVAWNSKSWQNHCPVHLDNKDLFVICKRVAMRVTARKLGS